MKLAIVVAMLPNFIILFSWALLLLFTGTAARSGRERD